MENVIEKIIGNPMTSTVPQADWLQENSKKADFIKNKPIIPTKISDLEDDTTPENTMMHAEYAYKDVNGDRIDITYTKKTELDDYQETQYFETDGFDDFTADMLYYPSTYAVKQYTQSKLSNYATKSELNESIGNIETALDGIIAIQNSLLGVVE